MKTITLDRHIHIPVGEYVAEVHGWFAHLAMKGKWKIVRLPRLTEDPFTQEFTGVLKAISDIVTRDGHHVLPFKYSIKETKNSYALLVHKSSPMGSFIDGLSVQQRDMMYANAASICQYGNQPFDNVALDIPVRVFDEGSITITAESFRAQLQEKVGSDKAEAMITSGKGSVTAPFGDGQMYMSSNSELWDIMPETIRGMDRASANAMKIIGKMCGNPLVFLKGVIVKLSHKEWEDKCRKAGISPSFTGILTNTHSVKNKLKFTLSGELTFDIGYHNDDRQFENKTQIFGNQAYRRSSNRVSKLGYSHAVRDFMDEVSKAVADKDIKNLVAALSGDAKVREGTPFYGVVLNLLGRGLPLTYVRELEDSIRNMIIKRAGRPKIKLSTRVLPKGSDDYGVLECGITPTQARRLRVRLDDTIVVIRSPKASGFPALTMKVKSVSETCFAINSVLYARFNQGDHDGDTVALYNNSGIVEMKHSLVDTFKILFEDSTDLDEYHEELLQDAFAKTVKLEDKFGNMHPVIGPLYQMIRAKSATGPYDNFATRLQAAGASDTMLRSFWNNVTQVTVTNMKHVGDMIASPMELGRVMKENEVDLAKLDDIHFFLNSNRDNYINAQQHTNHPASVRILDQFENLKLKAMIDANKEYAAQFKAKLIDRLGKLMNWAINHGYEDIVKGIFRLDADNNITWFNRYGVDIFILLNGSFKDILNPPKGHSKTMGQRFTELKDAVTLLANGDQDKELLAWKCVYAIALAEPYKRWLLSNTVSDKVDVVVSSMVERIAAELGFRAVKLEE